MRPLGQVPGGSTEAVPEPAPEGGDLLQGKPLLLAALSAPRRLFSTFSIHTTRSWGPRLCEVAGSDWSGQEAAEAGGPSGARPLGYMVLSYSL